MKQFLLLILGMMVLSSCYLDKKLVLKGDYTFRAVEIDSTAPMVDENGLSIVDANNIQLTDHFHLHKLERRRVNQSYTTGVTDAVDHLFIGTQPIFNLKDTIDLVPGKHTGGWKTDNLGKIYAPEEFGDAPKQSFKYLDGKIFLQGLSVPIKIRPKRKSASFTDTFVSTTETGFNANLALGYKMNLNIFHDNKDFLGNNTTKISGSFGVLFGLGTTDLNNKTTELPTIDFSRKAPVFSTGLFFMVGINSINFGYSIGFDKAMGNGAGSWIYKNQLWHGITIGFDIIK